MQSEVLWVVAVDGAAARFFVRERSGLPLKELTELSENSTKHHGGHDHVGHGHQTPVADRNPRQQDEHVFLHRVAGQIDRAVIEHAVGRLILCAPPQAMGLLRSMLSANARQVIVRELTKDLVRETVAEIDARLTDHEV
ncbi:MAG TPA: host attachment protein [Hyphomonadaceae bacterium]|nr:host attachment protein [Hyphomonadaceae bacterium]